MMRLMRTNARVSSRVAAGDEELRQIIQNIAQKSGMVWEQAHHYDEYRITPAEVLSEDTFGPIRLGSVGAEFRVLMQHRAASNPRNLLGGPDEIGFLKDEAITLVNMQRLQNRAVDNKTCQKCGLVTRNDLSKCNKCKTTRYCDRACQKADWKQHKKHCIDKKKKVNL
jgi:hypothetical protein